MTLYNVHFYREVHLTFESMEADTPEAAAAIACDKSPAAADDIDDCGGETFSAVVDVAGDDQPTQSVTIDFQAERLRKAAPQLLKALIAVLPYARAEAEGLEGFRGEDEVVEQEADRAWEAVEQADAVLATIPHTERRPEANAALNAAAPEMLAEAIELLRNAEYADGYGTVLTQDCEALEAAIPKATGESRARRPA